MSTHRLATTPTGAGRYIRAREATVEIVWHGPVLQRSGYASLARGAVRGLHRAGVQVRLTQTRLDPRVLAESIVAPADLEAWSHMLGGPPRAEPANRVHVCCHTPIGSDGHDAYARAARIEPGATARVGLTMFETDRLPRSWVTACNDLDRVWVPSTFNRDVFIESGVDATRVEVVHPGIATWWLDTPAARPDDGSMSVVFLSVFEWRWRKGWDVLLRAYLRAFDRADETVLVIRASPYRAARPDVAEQVRRFVELESRAMRRRVRDAPRIEVIEQMLTISELAGLYRRADAFVLPSRGEGFGLPYLEAMAVGLPVIATAWSGQQDFLTPENSFPIGIDGTEAVGEHGGAGSPYEATMRWASPSVDDAVTQLRRVRDDPVAAWRKGARARADVRGSWTEDHAATRYLAAAQRSVAEAALGHPSRRSAEPATLRLVARVYGISGYATEARAWLAELDAAGVAVAALHLRSDLADARIEPSTQRLIERCLARQIATAWLDIQHLPLGALNSNGQAIATVARTAAVGPLKQAEAEVCATFDEIWVPTAAQRDRFVAAGLDAARIIVVPVGLADRFRFERPADRGNTGFTFLCSLDATRSHAIAVIVDALALEFLGADDDVSLRIRLGSSAGRAGVESVVAQLQDRLTRLGLRPAIRRRVLARIELDTTPLADAVMPRLYRSADAYIELWPGAGLDMGLIEAAAADLPIVAGATGCRCDLVDDASATVVHLAPEPRRSSQNRDADRNPAIESVASVNDAEIEAVRAALRAVAEGTDAVATRRREMRRRIAVHPTTADVVRTMVSRSRNLLGL